MDILLNPNIAYMGLVLAFVLTSMALLSPGTGLIEISALAAILYSAFAIYNIPINYLALGVLIAGVIPFMVAVRRSGKPIYLVISIAALVLGSIFLFVEEGLRPVVNPFLALIVSSLTAVFMWVMTRKTLEAVNTPPAHDPDHLIGKTGTATSDIQDEGTIQIESELWSARSEQLIPNNSEVRVTGRDGFTLIVEPVRGPSDNGNEPQTSAGESGGISESN